MSENQEFTLQSLKKCIDTSNELGCVMRWIAGFERQEQKRLQQALNEEQQINEEIRKATEDLSTLGLEKSLLGLMAKSIFLRGHIQAKKEILKDE